MKPLISILAIIVISTTVLLGCSSLQKAAAPESQRGQTSAADSSQPLALGNGAPSEEAPNGSKTAQSPSPGNLSQPAWDRMIVRNASITVTVRDVENSLAAVRDIATAANGWVAQSNTRYEGERQVASITIQVPTSSFDAAVSEIRKLAIKVDSEVTNTQDVTEEYTDLESQLRNLQATEASLLSLMAKAQRIEDILALQRELTNIRGQIEKLQGRLNYLQRRVEMSTISVSLAPVGAPKPGDRPAWSPLQTALKAWEASTVFLQFFVDAVIAIVVFFWWLIPLIVVAWLTLRSRLRRRPTPAA